MTHCPECATGDRMCRECVKALNAHAEAVLAARAKEVRAAIVAAQIAEAHRRCAVQNATH